MWRVWHITAILIGMALLGWSVVLYATRQEDSGFYLMLGQRTDLTTSCCIGQYYVYSPDGKALFPIEGAIYEGDFSSYDLSWLPDGSGFLEETFNEAPQTTSILSLNGRKRRVIEGLLDSLRFLPPGFSPDHKSLAFIAYTPSPNGLPPEGRGIRIITLAGDIQHSINLPEPDVVAFPPVFWSPDGEWLYTRLCKWEVPITCGLYQVRPDGTDWTQLSDFVLDERNIQLKWSPDGTQFCFVNQFQIWMVPPLAEINADNYAYPAGDSDYSPVHPLWSGDNQWIIYQRSETSIHRLRYDGTENAAIVTDTTGEGMPNLIAVSADNWVYYWQYDPIRDFLQAANIYRISLSGGEPQLVLRNTVPRFDFRGNEPIFTPDGWLITNQMQPDDTADLYQMRLDGSQRRLLFDDPNPYGSQELNFRLSPDKQWILIGNHDNRVYVRVHIASGEVERFSNPDPNITETIFMNPSPLISMPYRAGLTALIGAALIIVSVLLSRFR